MHVRARDLVLQGMTSIQTKTPRTPTTSPTRRTSTATRSGAVNVQMPRRGNGFTTYAAPSRQYATQRTVNQVQNIAQRYNARTGRNLEIGEISRRGGGANPGHSSHRRGIDVDIRPQSRNGGPTTWRSPGYDRNATREMIREVRRENPNARILFNDPQLIREGLTRPYKGHDNHLHVSLR